jgi:hypothetical protein
VSFGISYMMFVVSVAVQFIVSFVYHTFYLLMWRAASSIAVSFVLSFGSRHNTALCLCHGVLEGSDALPPHNAHLT